MEWRCSNKAAALYRTVCPLRNQCVLRYEARKVGDRKLHCMLVMTPYDRRSTLGLIVSRQRVRDRIW